MSTNLASENWYLSIFFITNKIEIVFIRQLFPFLWRTFYLQEPSVFHLEYHIQNCVHAKAKSFNQAK